MQEEFTQEAQIEKIRLQHQALAANPHTSSDYIKSLFKEEDETEMEEYEWETPQTLDEVEALLKSLDPS